MSKENKDLEVASEEVSEEVKNKESVEKLEAKMAENRKKVEAAKKRAASKSTKKDEAGENKAVEETVQLDKESDDTLSLSDFDKVLAEDKKYYSQQEEHSVLIAGKEGTYKVDQKFRKTKQYKVLDDIVAFIEHAQDDTYLLSNLTPYGMLMIIKQFTTIEVPDDIDEALEILNVLTDHDDAIIHIINSMPEDELTKTFEQIGISVDTFTRNLSEELEKVEGAGIDNEFLLDKLTPSVEDGEK